MTRDRGSASIWVLACCGLVAVIAYASVLRTSAVLARHRVETAADLAALAAAGRIGVGTDVCGAAADIAAMNGARVIECVPTLAADGRSGEVSVRLAMVVRLAVVGTRTVVASARAGRLATAASRRPPRDGRLATW